MLMLTMLAAGGGGSGCVAPQNDSPAFSDGTVMESMKPLPTEPTYTKPDEPSITTLDRSAWPVTEYTVAQRDTVHQPTYRSKQVSLTHASAIQRGEYPTAETAGENVTGNSGGDQALEAVLAPLQAVADVVLMIPRAFVNKPTAPVRGPTVPVDRIPPKPPAVSPVAAPAIPAAEPAPATPAAEPHP